MKVGATGRSPSRAQRCKDAKGGDRHCQKLFQTDAAKYLAGILYPVFGVLLNPMIAGAAMTFSSVSAISNALRLNRLEI